MPTPHQLLVQQVIVLASGAPGSGQVQSYLLSLYEANADWAQIAEVIDGYMNTLVPNTAGGINGLVKQIALNGFGAALSDADVTGVIEDLSAQGIASWSQLFYYLTHDLNGTLANTLTNRAEAASTFTSLLSTLDKNSDYEGSQALNAARVWLNGISADEATQQAAEDTATNLIARFIDGNVQNTVIDGYVANATVFIDVNGNGEQDQGEPSTTTDADGNFLFEGDLPAGSIVARGGTDLATGQPFTGTMTAPSGSTVITPLTTLVQQIIADDPTKSVSDAQQVVRKALDLPTVDLGSYDPINKGLESGATKEQQATAAKMQAATSQVVNLLNVSNSLLKNLDPNSNSNTNAGIKSLINTLKEAADTNKKVDLSNQDTLSQVLKNAATYSGIVKEDSAQSLRTKVDNLSSQAGQSLQGVNSLTRKAADDFAANTNPNTSLTNALSDVFKLQSLTQTQLSTAIQTNTSGDLTATTQQFTGSNLVQAAGQVTGGSLTRTVPVGQGSVTGGGTNSNAGSDDNTETLAGPTIALKFDTGTSATDRISNKGIVQVTSATDATWEYSFNGGNTWLAGSGNSFELTGAGAKAVLVRQTLNEITSAPASLAFTLDQSVAKPSLSIEDTGSSDSDFITNNGTITVGSIEQGATWQYSTNGGSTWANGSGSAFELTEDGSYRVQVRQSDVAGNTSKIAYLGPEVTTSSLSLGDLNGSNGFRLDGVSSRDYTGRSVSSAGDINGDGIDDLIIGGGGSPSGTSISSSYVVFGSSAGFNNTVSPSALNGSNGFRLDGVAGSSQAGYSVSSAGDVNGDGIDDLIIGAPRASPADQPAAGSSYVIFGSSAGFSSSLALSALNGNNGFRLDGIGSRNYSGSSVSSAGDVNGDGIDDLIIGAFGAGSFAGSSYVVFGSSAGFSSTLALSALNGSNGFSLDGASSLGYSGHSVSSVGDVNGDGIDDFIIGAHMADPSGPDSGSSYVVFGSSAGFSNSLALSTLNGNNGFRLDGVSAGDNSGYSVSGAGDINDDGIHDLIIGAHNADLNGSNSGSSYVVFGSSVGFSNTLALSALNGSNGFRLDGAWVGDNFGVSVSGAGDVNGDGIDDLIIGASRADTFTGESYVVFGSNVEFTSTLALSALNSSNGFRLGGVDQGDVFGSSVSSAGDVNGDGFDDLIIGAIGADHSGQFTGASYVVFANKSIGSLVLDTTAAMPTLSSNIDTDASDGIATYNRELNVSGIETGATWQYRIDAGEWTNGEGTSITLAEHGTFTVGVRQIDLAGNVSDENPVEVASTNPVPTPTLTLQADSGNASDGITNNGTLIVGDLEEGATWEYSLDGSTWVAGGNDGRITLTEDGDYQVSVRQTNADEIVSETAQLSVTLDQTVATPTVSLEDTGKSDTDLTTKAGTITVGNIEQGATWEYSLNGGNTWATGSGSTFELPEDGSYRIHVRQSDVAGNASSIVSIGDDVATSALSLSGLNGSNGFRLDGVSSSDHSGRSVSSAGDVNGDGIDDLIIGAFEADLDAIPDAGASYVVFGSSTGFNSTIALSALDGSNGFRLDGANPSEHSGISVSNAGDVNDDGIDDLIIGAHGANSFTGSSYVVFGNSAGFSSTLALSELNASNGFRLDGVSPDDASGRCVSNAGDVNGDGIDDLIVGALGASGGAGASYVVFGNSAGFSSALALSTLDGSNGFRLDGIGSGDGSGISVSSAGDINGDGIDDLIIGANGANTYAGESYVVFGSSTGFSSSLALNALDGNNGFRLDGVSDYSYSGDSVSSAGDVNGDGIDDLIIGASGASAYAGSSYVVFGSSAGFNSSLALNALDGSNGFRLDGVSSGDFSGASVSSAGDVNGDGIDDLIIGANSAGTASLSRAGASYVVFGSSSGFSSSMGLDALDGSNGFRLDGVSPADLSGFSVSSAGDVNGDGIDDLIIGATGVDHSGQYSGASYVVFGSTSIGPVVLDTTVAAPTLTLANDTDTPGDFSTSDGAINVANIESGASWQYRIDSDSDEDWQTGTASSLDLSDAAQGEHTVDVRQTDIAGNVSAPTSLTFTLTTESTGGGSNTVPALSALNGSNGFRLDGTEALSSSGAAVSNAGDINGDGYDDFLIGAHGSSYGSGAAFVVFGQASGFASSINLSSLDGSNGFRLNAESDYQGAGFSVSSAGDFNGDGYADIIIGAPYSDLYAPEPGAAYLIFGKSTGFAASIDLSSLNASDGFKLEGTTADDRTGMHVANMDFNGDGYDDLIVGALGDLYDVGSAYVVYGTSSALGSSIALSSLDGTSGFRLRSSNSNDGFGHSVRSAGDINGDGYEDLIVGAFSTTDETTLNFGTSYVLFGSGAVTGATINTSALTGSNGFRIVGNEFSQSGASVSHAGDINGDGLDDLIIGAPGENYGAGASYVLFGSTSGFASTINLSALNGSTGFRLAGDASYDALGHSVSRAGDINGDGFDDLIVGAPGTSDHAGATYIIFGKGSFSANVTLPTNDSTAGFKLLGASYDAAGFSVSAAGDINGDGFDDLMVGASSASINAAQSGSTYVIFGADFSSTVTHSGTSANDTPTGSANADIIVTGDGDDVISAGGGSDVVRTGRGDDTINVPDLSFNLIDGGTGIDTLALTGANLTLNFDTIAGTIRNIEAVDLTGSGNNTLEISKLALLHLSQTSNSLTVEGDTGDTLQALGSGWQQDGTEGAYNRYINDNAVLLIGVDLTVNLNVI